MRMKIVVSWCTLCIIIRVSALGSDGPTSRRSVLRNQVLFPASLMGVAAQEAEAKSLPFMGTTTMLANPDEYRRGFVEETSTYISNGILWKTGSGQALPATPSFLQKIVQNEVLGSTLSSGIVCISERHDDFEHHKVQLKVLMTMKKVLTERSQNVSDKLSIGMEMFQRQHQKYLDRFAADDKYTLVDLQRDTDWDSTWGYDIFHYIPILTFAKKFGIRIVGLHPSNDLVEMVKREGLSNISPSIIDGICMDDRRHAVDFKQLAMQRLSLSDDFGGCQEALDAAISRQYEVQCFREEYMAQSAANQMARNDGGWIAILAGEGHVRGRNGLPFRALRRFSTNNSTSLSPSRGVFTIIPKTISFPMATKHAPGIDLADYVWYVQRDPSTKFREGKINLAPRPSRWTEQQA